MTIAPGDPAVVVQKALGEPDAVLNHTLADYNFFFFQEDIEIVFRDGRVAAIQHGVPTEIKEQFKLRGKHLLGLPTGQGIRQTLHALQSA